jgi:hypothetical protein
MLLKKIPVVEELSKVKRLSDCVTLGDELKTAIKMKHKTEALINNNK